MSIQSLMLDLLGAAGAAFVWRHHDADPPTHWPPPATAPVLPHAREADGAAAPHFSVIVPTYNRGRLVEEAIDSVLTQRAGNLELIVVDDGSTDDTARRLSRIHDRRLRRLRLPHRGAAAARNAGISASSGAVV